MYIVFKFSECSTAGSLELITSQSVPHWWDDTSNYKTLEDIAVAAFNKVRVYMYIYIYFISA